MIKFMLITNDPVLAVYAESCGVDRIFVDLEQMGKVERQGHRDTLISNHSMKDVARVKKELTDSELLVRLNPFYAGTENEIEEALSAGADLLMLPMFYNAKDVFRFCELVNDRAGVVPLVETYEAALALDEIVRIPGVTEIYIGLNDLHMDMQLKFIFEPLANGFVDKLVDKIKAAGLPFGFGGIARVGEGVLPGEMVLGEHLRLGSSSVILSRTFHRRSVGFSQFKDSLDLKVELDKLEAVAKKLKLRNSVQMNIDHLRFKEAVEKFVVTTK